MSGTAGTHPGRVAEALRELRDSPGEEFEPLGRYELLNSRNRRVTYPQRAYFFNRCDDDLSFDVYLDTQTGLVAFVPADE